MNILFCGDENIKQGIFLSTLSLCKNTDKALSIYILTANVKSYKAIPKSFAESLAKSLKAYNKNSKAVLIDISEAFNSYLPLSNIETRFTPLCMLRLFADTVDCIPDRILYLDADVMCRGDFFELYNSDISEAEMAGAADRYGKWFFGNIFKHDYLNSGVLLLNMKNIRASGLFGKCRNMCRDKKMFMPDQSALNKLAVKIKINRKYNEQGKIKKDTVFNHFSTYFKFFPFFHSVTVKPWEEEKMHRQLGISEFDTILEEYKRRSSNE